MADEHRDQEDQRQRRPISDPRLKREERTLTSVEIAALWSGWAAVLLLLILVFWLIVNPSFHVWQKVLLGVDVALAVFWGVIHRGTLVGATRARGVRLGTNSLLFTVFVLGILVLFNIVAARHHVRKDITADQQYSLSEQTTAVVEDLNQDVSIIAFLSKPEAPGLRDRLREYNMLSPRVQLHIYDPLLDAEKAGEYSIHSSTTDVLIIKSGEREEKIYGGDEEQITSTILAVTVGEKIAIYFLVGHGEPALDERDGTGLTTIKTSLENQQYEVNTLNLAIAEEPEIPADCAVLVVAGPTEPIRQEALDAMASYARQGGNLLVAVEPGGPKLTELLEPWGVRALDGTVYDRNYGFLGAAEIPMAAVAGNHRIVEQLGRVALAMPTTAALEIIEPEMDPEYDPYMPPPSSPARPLLETSSDAWLETGQTDAEDFGARQRGPFVLAAVVGGTQEQGPMGLPVEEDGPRMVVLGDADMMTDQFINLGLVGNARLVLNSINWLVENEKLISIPPTERMPRYMIMDASQRKLVWAISVGIVPLIIGLAGIIVWWRRR